MMKKIYPKKHPLADENEYETDSDSDSVAELSGDDNDDVVAVTCGDIDSSEENDDNEHTSDK